jgi:hypothetical protein
VLRGSRDSVAEIAARAEDPAFADLLVVDYPVVGQATRDYDEYLAMLASIDGASMQRLGIALYGDPRAVARLTGNLPLLR